MQSNLVKIFFKMSIWMKTLEKLNQNANKF